MSDTAGQGTAAERDENDVEPYRRVGELEPDRRGAFAGREIEAVLDEVAALVVGVRSGEDARHFDVSALEMHGRAQRPHPVDLQRAGGLGGEHGDGDPAACTAVGEGLAEVAGARAHRGRVAALA